jgi:adenylate cyclase
LGIAGLVFTSRELCVPVITKDCKRIGVTQVLNKRGGPFSGEDEQGSFEQSLKAFELGAQVDADDKLSDIYLQRCRHLMANPPEKWDGVWHLTEK